MLQHALTTDQSVTSASGLDVPVEDVFANATNKHQGTLPLSKNRFIDTNAVEECNVCHNVRDQAVEVVCCQELFCPVCTCDWLQTHNECPVCLHDIKASELKRRHKILRRLLGNVAAKLIGHLVASRESDGCLEVRMGTHGKSQVYERTTVSNVPSDVAGKSTYRRRS